MNISQFISAIDDFAWGPVMLILLVGTGVYLSARMRFIQFSRIPYWWKNTAGKLFRKHEAGRGEVTPLQALTTALAATVGTGNIAGVTGAIFIGGPGAVFWMWVAALAGMMTKYSEVVLAVKYRERNAHGDWVGGPMYYIKNGLGKNWAWLGGVFCVLAALAAFGIGNATQVQSIADAINNAVDSFTPNAAGTFLFLGSQVRVTTFLVGLMVAVIVALVLFGGIKRIGQVTERLVPFMAVVYIVAALIVIFANIAHIGQVFALIFRGAFSPDAAVGGIDISWGAGGSGANVAAAMSTVFGSRLGAVIIAVCLSLFALSTILSWSLYGTRCFEYLFGVKATRIYQGVFVLFVIIGATMSLADAWNLADALNGFMAIPNLIALLALSGVTVKLTKEHLDAHAPKK